MKGGTGQLWPLVLVLVFYGVPIGFLASQPLGIFVQDETTRIVLIGVLNLAALACVASLVFLGLYVATSLRRRGRPATIGELRRSGTYSALGYGLMLPPVAIVLGLSNPLYALVYTVLVGFYLMYAMPDSRRRVGYVSSITVRCTPEAAFALVSDPRNWPRYLPDVQVIEPVETPLRVGSIVAERVMVGRRAVEGHDEVTLVDPDRKLGMRSTEGPASDLYEFKPVNAGTEVAYSAEIHLSVSEAVIGGALRRGAIVKLLLARREAAMQRLKQILEAPAAATV